MSQLPTRHKHIQVLLLVTLRKKPLGPNISGSVLRVRLSPIILKMLCIYLQAVEPQSLHRPLKPSQQCFQQPEPHFVTSAGVREPGKKN